MYCNDNVTKGRKPIAGKKCYIYYLDIQQNKRRKLNHYGQKHQAFQKMSTLKFGEQEAGEELLSAALYVEEGQDGDEGAPQDGMAYLRCPASIITLIITSTK